MVFICVGRRIYARPMRGALAPPEQAIFDFAHLAHRQGLNPASLVTFRGLDRLKRGRLAGLAKRYPVPVGEAIRKLVAQSA